MIAFPYRLHEKAFEEYIEAYEWYEIRQNGLGGRFMSNVESKLKQISGYPLHYPANHGKFREAKVNDFPYTIVYEVLNRKQLIHVSAIYHAKRNPKGKYRKMKK